MRLTVYVSDLHRFAPMVDEVQAELWGKPPYPPRTMIEAQRLFDDDIVKIDSIFLRPNEKISRTPRLRPLRRRAYRKCPAGTCIVAAFPSRRVDTRAGERMALGTSMMRLGRDLAELKYPMVQAGPAIKSRFISARKLGIWAPDDRVFGLHPNHADDLVRDYLMHVGQMLRDGNFREAKREAKDREAAFSSACAYQLRNKSFKAIP